MIDISGLGYCGVDCLACSDLASGACPGCRESVWPEGDACPPVACCQKRGIAVCGSCAEFPCPMIADFYRESESHERAGRLMQRVFAATFGTPPSPALEPQAPEPQAPEPSSPEVPGPPGYGFVQP